jgi:hypothetical protein
MTPTTPGMPLSESEAEHVITTLVNLIETSPPKNDKSGIDHFSCRTPDMIRQLGWAQARHPDLRDFLGSAEGQRRLAQVVGREITERPFVSRNHINVDFGKSYKASPVDTGHEAFQKAVHLFLHGFQSGVLNDDPQLSHPHYTAGHKSGRLAYVQALTEFCKSLPSDELPEHFKENHAMGQTKANYTSLEDMPDDTSPEPVYSASTLAAMRLVLFLKTAQERFAQGQKIPNITNEPTPVTVTIPRNVVLDGPDGGNEMNWEVALERFRGLGASVGPNAQLDDSRARLDSLKGTEDGHHDFVWIAIQKA